MLAKDEWVGRWVGRTVACVASGPSLTPDDCDAVRAAGLPTIVTNTTFRLCPWADVLMGFDGRWWREYRAEVDEVFKGRKLTCSQLKTVGAESLYGVPWFRLFANSGASAISLAISAGARRVLLLGYDCQMTGGRAHWHPDHPKSLTNCKSMPNWPQIFASVAKFAKSKDVEVVNCSRETALKCFPREDLAKWL
jgi:hypothetical protein